MDPLVARLSLTQLSRDFGPPTVQRARGLERGVHISERASSQGRFIAMGTVEGSHRYQTMVTLTEQGAGVKVSGSCSCPVARQCKHAVALCLVLIAEAAPAFAGTTGSFGTGRSGLTAGTPTTPRRPDLWAGPLDELLRELAALPAAGAAPAQSFKMALRFELDPTPSRYGGPLALTLRPMRVGKTGRWVKAGASWSDVAASNAASVLDDAQQATLDAVADALGGPSAAAQQRAAEASTPRWWAALERAIAAGVELIPDGALESIELSQAPADVAISVTERPTASEQDPAAGNDVSLAVRWEGSTLAAKELIPLGRRTHGVLMLLPGQLPGQFRGVLARLARPLNEQLSYTLRMGRTIAVPAEGREKLVDDVLPRLARHVPVSASNPELMGGIPEPPELVALVTWRGLDAAELAFGFAYRRRGEESVVPLAPVTGSPGTARRARTAGWAARHDASAETQRQPAAEAAALAAWVPGPEARALLNVNRDGRVGGQAQRFEGGALVHLSTRLLPELRAQMPVRESGHAPTLRALDGDPLVSFEVEQAPGGAVDWLDLAVSIVVDGEAVPLSEVIAAFTAGEELILLPSGAYVPAEHPVLRRLAAMVQEARSVRRGGRREEEGSVRVGARDVELWGEVDTLGVANPAAQRWIENARTLSPEGVLPRVEPVGVVTEMRDYQRAGLDWLSFLHDAGLGGILADDMGLGKTLQVLALIARARHRGAAPFLVIAPTSVVGAWQRQAGTHTPGLTVRTVQATATRRKSPLAEVREGADIVVTSYTLLRAEAEEYAELEWGGLILDEAQAIKNAASKTFQAVRGIEAPFALAVTGTPVENRLGELWPQLAVVAPGLYPTLESFTRLVVTPVERNEDQVALERMRARVRPFLLRRTKALVASALPPKQEEVLTVALSKGHRHFYDALLQRERQEVMGLVEELDTNRVAVFAALTRLRLASLHAGLVDPELEDTESAKIAELIPRLTELAQEGHRALVFSQFTSFLGRIRTAVEAAGLEVVYLDGSTRDRAAVLDAFAQGKAPVFLISLKAGGVGLTLTEADYVFLMDPWWNPAVEAQAVDRAHRIGQERPVMVYRLVAEGTIEEKVMQLKERKAALFDAVMDGAQASPSALGEEELRELLG